MAWLKRDENAAASAAGLTNVTPLISLPQGGGIAGRAKPILVPASAILVALLAVVGAASNWDRWNADRAVQSTDDAAVFADVSNVSARVGGTVQSISVDDYARVKAGDVLFTIDRAPYDVAVRSSKAKLEAARAQLDNNASQRTFQLAQIDVALAQQQASTADEIQTRKELERQSRLANDSGASSLQNLEKATAGHERALANAKMSEAAVAAQRAQLDVLAKQRDALRANVDTAMAELAAAELELSYTLVRAPFDGVVARRNIQLGTFAAAGTSMISIVPLPDIYVLANYKESQVANVHEGEKVDISVDTFPGQSFRGTVSRIAPASGSTFAVLPADNASGNFTKVAQRLSVRVELDPTQADVARLRPGMSVVTHIATRN